jgi:hypothetical protein
MIFIITLVTISKYPVLFYYQTVKRNKHLKYRRP